MKRRFASFSAAGWRIEGASRRSANRLLEVARGLEARGAGVTVHSICDGSDEEAPLGAVDAIRRGTEGACLPHLLPVEADGRASCELRVTMPEGLDCDREGFTAALDDDGAPVPSLGRCGVPCESRVECRAAGLDSFRCSGEGVGDTPRFCVDPSCG